MSASKEPKDAIRRVAEILDRVYSPYTGPGWKPRAFTNRSRRYLWSDAFGVCGYISLFHGHAGASRYLAQADALIGDVHATLGCHRDSTTRLGGASAEHPTRGGLRIGKEEACDDGQYFHYLTKWMFALNRMSIARGDATYNDWAVELAEVAHRHFVIHGVGGRALRMVWKMSIDLQQVAVSSSGNLDPFDGLVTYQLLQQASPNNTVLGPALADFQELATARLATFATHDALDSGEALWLSTWLPRDDVWAKDLGRVALGGIDVLFRSGHFEYPKMYRLMFREMGTVLGLKAALAVGFEGLEGPPREASLWSRRIEELLDFWKTDVFSRDEDITPLMYAAALYPGVWIPPTT